ncbi:MAG: hypothetical protein V1933_02180 [Candidatus Omnitrophota bacterium]
MKQDKKEAHFNRMDRNNDGMIDETEKGAWKKHIECLDVNRDGKINDYERQTFQGRDRDNNPPGQAGGQGTNWENVPGPAGGPGASPNVQPSTSTILKI